MDAWISEVRALLQGRLKEVFEHARDEPVLAPYEPDDEGKRRQREREKVNQHGNNPTYSIVTGPFARAEA